MIEFNINNINEEYSITNYYNGLAIDHIDTDSIGYKSLIAVNQLNEYDRRIMLMYAELHSTQKVADILNVSKSTVQKKIKQIKAEIIQRIKNNEYDNNN